MKIFCRIMFVLVLLVIAGFITSTIVLTTVVSPAYRTLIFLHLIVDPVLGFLAYQFLKFSRIDLADQGEQDVK